MKKLSFKKGGTLRSIVESTTGSLLYSILSFLIVMMLGKFIDRNLFGIYAAVQSIGFTVDRILSPQSWQAAIKFSAAEEDPETLSIVFWLDMLVAVLVVVTCVALGFLLHNGKDYQNTDVYLLLMVLLSSAISFNNFNISITRLKNKYFTNYLIMNLAAIAKITLVILTMLNQSFSGTQLLIYLCYLDLARVIAITIYYRLITKIISPFAIKRENFIKVLKYSSFSFINSILDAPVKTLDVYLVSLIASVEMAGVYKVIRQVAQLSTKFVDPIYAVLFPKYQRQAKTDSIEKLKDSFKKNSFYLLILNLLIMILAVAILYYTYRINQYFYYGLLLCTVMMFNSTTMSIHAIFLAHKKISTATKISLAANLALILTCLALKSYSGLLAIIFGILFYHIVQVSSKYLILFSTRRQRA